MMCCYRGGLMCLCFMKTEKLFSLKTCQLSFRHFSQFKTGKRWRMEEYDEINLCTARQKDGSKTSRRNVYPKIVLKQGQKILLSFNLSRLLLLKGLWYFYERILRGGWQEDLLLWLISSPFSCRYHKKKRLKVKTYEHVRNFKLFFHLLKSERKEDKTRLERNFYDRIILFCEFRNFRWILFLLTTLWSSASRSSCFFLSYRLLINELFSKK